MKHSMQSMPDSEMTMLTDELVLAVLVTSLRLAFPLAHRPDARGRRMRVADAAPALAPILNALQRSVAPELSHYTLLLMPWIDSNTAATRGDIWLLDTMHKKLVRAPWNRPLHYDDWILRSVSDQGYLHVLEWLENNLGWPQTVYMMPDNVAGGACANGHVRVVQWWTERATLRELSTRSGLGGDLLSKAAKGGHMDDLELLWSKAVEQGGDGSLLFGVVAHAIRLNRMDVLEWSLERIVYWPPKQPCSWLSKEVDAFVVAAAFGHRATLEVLLEKCGTSLFTPYVAAFACVSGDLAFVKWCASKLEYSPSCIHSPLAYFLASAFGHVHVLDWLLENQVAIGMLPYCQELAMYTPGPQWIGILHEVFPKEIGSIFKDYWCVQVSPVLAACATGQLESLEWWRRLKQSGRNSSGLLAFLTSVNAARLASMNNQVHVLDWLYGAGLDVCNQDMVQTCLHIATVLGMEDVLNWWQSVCDPHIFSKSCNSEYMSESWATAINDGQDDVVLWWLQSGLMDLAQHRDMILESAIDFGRVKILKWWMESEHAPLELDPRLTRSAAQSGWHEILDCLSGYFDVANWTNIFDLDDSTPHNFLFGLLGLWETEREFDMLMWWAQSGLDLGAMQSSFSEWAESLHPTYTVLLVDVCCKAGIFSGSILLDDLMDVPLLVWALKYSNKNLMYSTEFLLNATEYGNVDVLDWWKQSGLVIPVPAKSKLVECRCWPEVKEWWEQSGLLPNATAETT